MKYELINPSDKIFFEAPDVVHAAFASSLISTGYGATCLENEGEDSPIFMFGGAEEYFQERTGGTADEFLKKNPQTICDTLLSFRYNTRRTSIHQIVDTAHGYAELIKDKFLKESP